MDKVCDEDMKKHSKAFADYISTPSGVGWGLVIHSLYEYKKCLKIINRSKPKKIKYINYPD